MLMCCEVRKRLYGKASWPATGFPPPFSPDTGHDSENQVAKQDAMSRVGLYLHTVCIKPSWLASNPSLLQQRLWASGNVFVFFAHSCLMLPPRNQRFDCIIVGLGACTLVKYDRLQ